MTSRDNDWIDDVLGDEKANLWQLGKIESLLVTSSIAFKYDGINLTELTEDEAEEIIRELLWNNEPTDPKDQFQKRFRRSH